MLLLNKQKETKLGEKFKMAFALFVFLVGGCVLGFGIKFTQVWWLSFPNFIDGITTILGAVLLMIIGVVYYFKLLFS